MSMSSPSTPDLHIAMIIQRYAPLVGGAERLVAAIAAALQAQGVKVSILTRRYPGLERYSVIDGISVYRLPIPGPKVTASLSFTLAALPLLSRVRPTLIHAHEVFSPATTAMAAHRLLGAPVVLTAHRSGPLGDVQRLQRKLFGKQRMATFRKKVAGFICISQEIASELKGVGVPEERLRFIPTGVDTRRFFPVAPQEKQTLRDKLGLPDGLLTIFTGRLAPEKRIDQLIALWPKIHQRIPNAHLIVLGTGELQDSLAAYVQTYTGGSVHLLGVHEDVDAYLRAADLFILPSAAEGLSLSMLEAMASGLPVLVTKVGGAADVITQGIHGWLIPPDAPAALESSILQLLVDEGLRARLGQNARQHVTAQYSMAYVAQEHLALYRQVIQSRKGETAP